MKKLLSIIVIVVIIIIIVALAGKTDDAVPAMEDQMTEESDGTIMEEGLDNDDAMIEEGEAMEEGSDEPVMEEEEAAMEEGSDEPAV